MFGMFPFMYNNNGINNYNNNNPDPFFSLINNDFMNDVVDQFFSNDMINGIFEEDDYDISIKDYGGYYLIRAYLPGIGPKDVSIDFEKNKAILTIHKKKKQNYSNGNNIMVTIMQSSMDVVRTFYIEEIDVTKLSATFNDNLLLLTIPKIERHIYEGSGNEEPTIIDVKNYKVE